MTNRSESPPDASTLAVVSLPVEDGGVTDAGLQASASGREVPAQAPLASPSPPKKPRSVAAAAGKALAIACTAAACASGRGTRMESPQADCPPGAMEAMAKLRFVPPRNMGGPDQISIEPGNLPWDPVPVPPDGPVTFYVWRNIYNIPEGSVMHGRLFLGKGRLFGWITELVMPNGDRYPICANIVEREDRKKLGMPLSEGSTPEKPLFLGGIYIATTSRLGRLDR